MKDKKLGQDPAFPEHIIESNYNGITSSKRIEIQHGMSKRLYIATKILSGIASSGKLVVADYSFKDAVEDAYYITDLLLENE